MEFEEMVEVARKVVEMDSEDRVILFTLINRYAARDKNPEEGLKPKKSRASEQGEFQCDGCDTVFTSKRGYAIHKSRAHKHESEDSEVGDEFD